MLFIGIFIIYSCNRRAESSKSLQKEIDSLKAELVNTYKPGFGEFMTSIQVHHNKLWFAGSSKNWKLADFEIHEIKEALDGIKKYQSERKESQMIGMINPALDSIIKAIEKKNPLLFDRSYRQLTNSCNHCHNIVKFEFNVVKIPTTPPFSNQDFSTRNEK